MIEIALRLLELALLLLPVFGAAIIAWRSRWPNAPAVEVLLAACISVPFCIWAVVVLPGKFIPGRPLDYLLAMQCGMSGLALAVCAFRRRILVSEVRSLLAGALAARHETRYLRRALVFTVALTALATALFGAWTVPWTIDEVAYHLPQALQPLRDGRIGPSLSTVPWADSYPRGGALLYYWTIAITRTDAGVHPVSACFGAVFFLAVYVGGRRAGATRAWAGAAAALSILSPITLWLMRGGYVDLISAAFLASAIAFALPDREGRWSWQDAAACMLAVAAAPWVKITAVCLAGWIVVHRVGLAALESWRGERRAGGPGVVAVILLGGAALTLASIPYLQTWATYGTPTWPVPFRIGPWTLFDGYLDAKYFNQQMEVPLLRRHASFWLHPAWRGGEDKPGELGPIFSYVMLPAMVVAPLWLRQRRDRAAWCVILAAFGATFFFPHHHVARYSVYLLALGAIAFARLGSAVAARPILRGVLLVPVLGLSLAVEAAAVRTLVGPIRWYRGFGIPLLTAERNRPIRDRTFPGGPEKLSPAVRLRVRAEMGDGETLVFATKDYEGLLWDGRFRYSVEHRPARPWTTHWVPAHTPGFALAHAEAWLSRLRADGVDAVLAYSGSAEAMALGAPDSGFHMRLEQPAGEKQLPITLFRRDGTR